MISHVHLYAMLGHVTYVTNRESVTSPVKNAITSIQRSVISSSQRQQSSGAGPPCSFSTFWPHISTAAHRFFSKLHFSILGVYTQFLGPRPVTVSGLVSHELLSLRPLYKASFLNSKPKISIFSTFRPLFWCLLQIEPKGLTTGYKDHVRPGLRCYY